MLRAPVPEAPVDEDGDPPAGKGDVGCPAHVGQPEVDSESTTLAVQRGSQCDLGRCVSPPLTLHPLKDDGGGCWRFRRWHVLSLASEDPHLLI
jgi:hypothetical protein